MQRRPAIVMARDRLAAVPAPVLVLAGIVSVQFGGALAAVVVRQLGALLTVTMRMDVAALILLILTRPGLRGRSPRAWLVASLLGLSLAVMNLSFYASLARLPIGVAVTIEFIGPLGLAAAISRRPRDFGAVLLALLGVVAVSGVASEDWSTLDPLGILLAAVAGGCWAGYILATRAVGRLWAQLDGLTVAMLLAALLLTPFAARVAMIMPPSEAQLAAGATVAILSSVIPYSLELVALRRIDTRVFGILLSLDPAVAAVAGYLVLHEALGPVELAGMALVIAASVLVMVSARPATSVAADPGEELAELAELG